MQPESGCLFNYCLFSICLFGNYFHTHYQTQSQHTLLPPSPTTTMSPPFVTATCHERPPWAKRHVDPTSTAMLRHVPSLSHNTNAATVCHVTTTAMQHPPTTALIDNTKHLPCHQHTQTMMMNDHDHDPARRTTTTMTTTTTSTTTKMTRRPQQRPEQTTTATTRKSATMTSTSTTTTSTSATMTSMSTYKHDNSDHQTSTTKPRDSGYLLTHDDDPPWMNDEPPLT